MIIFLPLILLFTGYALLFIVNRLKIDTHAILIIHFIIQNFVNKSEVETKSKLLKDENYINIIARAEKRVLSPYFRSLNGERHNDYNPENLFPLYTV